MEDPVTEDERRFNLLLAELRTANKLLGHCTQWLGALLVVLALILIFK